MRLRVVFVSWICCVGLFGLALAPSARAQGTIRFANNLSSALTNGATGLLLPEGNEFSVALYYGGAGIPENLLSNFTAAVGITNGPGLFDGGILTVPIAPGTQVRCQVRAWESRFGATYEEAAVRQGALVGRSPSVLVRAGTNTTNPGSLTASGLRGTTLLPVDCLQVSCPGDTVVPAGTGGDAVVSFTATVSNNCASGSASVTCSPESGTAFPMGTTKVMCMALDTSGNSNSCCFNVIVQPPISPVVTMQPESVVAVPGETVTFTAAFIGETPLIFFWRVDGVPIVGASDSTLTLPDVGSGLAGDYDVVAINAFGSVTSLVATLTVLSSTATVPIINTGAVWRYHFEGAEPDPAWRDAGFDAGAWDGARAELGFGDGDERTVIGDAAPGFITAYFRRTFTLASPQAVSNLVLNLKADDGAVVYLNGVEVFRSNMPQGPVDYLTLALTSAEEPAPFYFTRVDPALLVAGLNVLAVEVHQWSPDSSDLSFDLQLLSNPGGPVPLDIRKAGNNVVLSWTSPYHRLQVASLLRPHNPADWTTLTNQSPVTLPRNGNDRYYRLVCP